MSWASSVVRPSCRASKKADRLTCRKADSNCRGSSDVRATLGARPASRAARTITPVRPVLCPEGNARARLPSWLDLDGVRGCLQESLKDPAQEFSQRGPLFWAEVGQDLVFEGFTRLLRAFDCHPTRGGQLDEVTAPVVGVAPAHREPGRFQLVEEQHHPVGVDQEGLLQLLLGDAAMVPNVAQEHELLEAHAQELFGGAPVQRLGDLREQRYQPRVRTFLHLVHLRSYH